MERADTQATVLIAPGELYRRAHKIEALARIIMDCTATASTRHDPARAVQLLKEIGAIAGQKESEE